MDKSPFGLVDEEIEARNMEYTPFNLIAERERSNREYRERRARLRELTTEQEKTEPTPRAAVDAKMGRVRNTLGTTAPGSPGALSVVMSCVQDLADAVAYILEKDAAQV